MPNASETPAPLARGPSLAGLALVALFVLAFATGWGALTGLRRGLAEVENQGYDELGFARGREVTLSEATRHGALGGFESVLPWVIAGVVLLLASRAGRAWARPEELARRMADPVARLRLQVAWALTFAAGSYLLAALDEPVLRAELAWLGLLALVSCVALEVVGRAAARALSSRDAARPARLFAACATLLPLALVLFDVDRRRVYRPFASDTLMANAWVLAGAAAWYWAMARLARHGRLPAPARWAAVGLCLPALLPLGVPVWAAAGETPALAAKHAYNVVLIGIDTLRADHTTLLDPAPGQRDLTPNLRALAKRGTVFTQATSQSPWTMPAFASIFTGKYPLQHGAVSLTGKLRGREVTLAEILRETGRVTGGFVAHDYVDHKHGFHQGFDEYDTEWVKGHASISSEPITDLAIDFVARHADRPFFLFAHYFDPHNEYHEHEGFDFAEGYQGWLREQLDMENLRLNRQMLGPPELDYVRAIYDEEIAYTDRALGRLITELDRRRLMERTVFVLVADHGEEFMDHGNFSHTTALYDELVHVPLFVVLPGGTPGRVVEDVAETRRVFSTVLEALGVEIELPDRAPGLFAPRAADAPPQVAYSMVWLPDAKPVWGKRFKIASVRGPRFKLIRDLTRGVDQLFDLDADPRETRDVSAAEPTHFAELKLALDAWVSEMQKSAGDVPMMEIDDALRARLHELGYM